MPFTDRVRSVPWTTWAPGLAVVTLLGAWGRSLPGWAVILVAAVLATSVLAAVHHAEVVAHRVGEPFGSLVLAVAVTVIEVSLIVTLILGGGPGVETLARDTVFAAVMITLNGIVGLSLFAATRGGRTTYFNAEGAGAGLATAVTLATLTLVLPAFTLGEPGPEFTSGQLAFASIAALVLYAAYVATQTVRHRDFFLPVGRNWEPLGDDDHADPPTQRAAGQSLALLLVALVGVVGLAKVESPAIEAGVQALDLPHAFVGVVIALLVLLPETLAAVRAARRQRTQTALNLGIGSAIASIGLTVPTLGLLSLWVDFPLHLGLDPVHIVLLGLTALVSVLTIGPGRATRLQAAVHLAIAAAYLFLSVSP